MDDDKGRGMQRLPTQIMNTHIFQTKSGGYKYIINTKGEEEKNNECRFIYIYKCE